MSLKQQPRRNIPYLGESAPKKITRLMFWFKVRSLLGKERFLSGTYLVLASREAGDVSVLLGFGVPLENIVAVERDPREAAFARLKYPQLVVEEDEVLSVAKRYPEGFFTVAFLDYCAQSSTDILDVTHAVMRRLVPVGGYLACAFLAGREKTTRESILDLKDEFQFELSRLPQEQRIFWEGTGTFVARSIYIQRQLQSRARKDERHLEPRAWFFYHSMREGRIGHPFCVYLAQVKKRGSRHEDVLTEPEYHHYESSDTDLRSYAVDLGRRTPMAHQLLNLPKSTVAAWKAHATRGTYKRKQRGR